MYSSMLLIAGLGYYLFVYQGVEGMQQQSSRENDEDETVHYPKTHDEAVKYMMYSKLPWNQNLGGTYVYSKYFPHNSLPTDESRQKILTEFGHRVGDMRATGYFSKSPLRYIDKVDMSLELTTVRSMRPEDALEQYQRQMRYLSMFTKQANPFETLRKLIGNASMYSRPTKDDYQSGEQYSGNYALFLQDYYFHLYYPTRNEWNIYVVQQQSRLTEVEKDVFTFLDKQKVQDVLDEKGEVVVTLFSTTGLELLANLLKADRTVVPQLERYEAAFTDDMWKRYFPYTWAEVNRKEAKSELDDWLGRLE